MSRRWEWRGYHPRYGAARAGSEYLLVSGARVVEWHRDYIVYEVDREDMGRQYRRLMLTNRALSPTGYATTGPIHVWVRNVYGYEVTGEILKEEEETDDDDDGDRD